MKKFAPLLFIFGIGSWMSWQSWVEDHQWLPGGLLIVVGVLALISALTRGERMKRFVSGLTVIGAASWLFLVIGPGTGYFSTWLNVLVYTITAVIAVISSLLPRRTKMVGEENEDPSQNPQTDTH